MKAYAIGIIILQIVSPITLWLFIYRELGIIEGNQWVDLIAIGLPPLISLLTIIYVIKNYTSDGIGMSQAELYPDE